MMQCSLHLICKTLRIPKESADSCTIAKMKGILITNLTLMINWKVLPYTKFDAVGLLVQK